MRTAVAFAFVVALAGGGACAPKQPAPSTPPADAPPSSSPDDRAAMAELHATLTDVNSKLVDTQAQLDAVLTQLDRLERKVEEATPRKPLPPKPQAGRPDPHATYRVPVGDAHARGRDTALVTIVAWTDFQ